MKCNNCGQEIVEEAKFCAFCGEKVEKVKRCSRCGTILMENASFCFECGNKVVDECNDTNKMNDIDYTDVSSIIEEKELDTLRDNIKKIISTSQKETYEKDECIELQENVIWTGHNLIDLRELSTVKEMKEQIGVDLNSDMTMFWHVIWPQWKFYNRELDYSTKWIGKISGKIFYYITVESWGESTCKSTKLHKCSIGTNEEENVKTWSEVKIFKDDEGNVRILANNITQAGYADEWILLNDLGEVLWESEKPLSGLRTRAKGWCFDYQCNDIYNSSLLLDFYTGNVLLEGYSNYEYYNLKERIIIDSVKIIEPEEYQEQHQLYYYENGAVVEIKEIQKAQLEYIEYNLNQVDACKLTIKKIDI